MFSEKLISMDERIEDLSLYSMLIRMEVAETNTEMSLGTGFIYEHENIYYLITNGHNITGVNPETNCRIAKKHAGFPTRVGLVMRVRNHEIRPGLFSVTNERLAVNLYSDDSHENPVWYIHPQYGYQVDVVAIPIGHKDQHPHLKPLSSCKEFNTEQPHVADDVFVLGYPFGKTDESELPIWKKGSIATEPFARYK